ncbi:MAG: IS3 family transposase [Proteobacteria bacterium]|nr:IS3 family transposase [Pseudomonadota bacterium]
MCRVFKLHRSGFYAWLGKPLSDHAIEDQRLLKRIKEFYVASGGTYGSPWIHRDLRYAGEACSVHRVAKIMRENRLRAQIGYKRRYMKSGKIGSIADNVLDRNFNPDMPNQAWVSDITPYLGKTENVNVTLPTLISAKIAQARIGNRSAFLAEAAAEKLAREYAILAILPQKKSKSRLILMQQNSDQSTLIPLNLI